MYRVAILADSCNEEGDRLTTFELTYPRFIHAQVLTHRAFSRNASSSRAIPVHKYIDAVEDEPVVPVYWGKNKRGMAATEEITSKDTAIRVWLDARDDAVFSARRLVDLGVHKQIVNRILEPFSFITTILSATTFDNWFKLRLQDAQPEICWLAQGMKQGLEMSEPETLCPGQWHTPMVHLRDEHSPFYVGQAELPLCDFPAAVISTARCARVSYLTHDGQRDLSADVNLHDRLLADGHWSPFEHSAMAVATSIDYGNFVGFKQYRKMFDQESGQ